MSKKVETKENIEKTDSKKPIENVSAFCLAEELKEDLRIILQKPKELQRQLVDVMVKVEGKDPLFATSRDWFYALAYLLRGAMNQLFIRSARHHHRLDVRRIYYLSMEYLPGRLLNKTLLDLCLKESAEEALHELGVDLKSISEEEVDPALGNGGLGRLAACFLDSLATHGYAGYGYGIRYEFGLFTQQIKDGEQQEHPEHWLRYGSPWEYARPSILYPINFYGRVEKEGEGDEVVSRWVDTENLVALAFDNPITGYSSDTVGNLRLWSARASRDFDLDTFNKGNYIDAVSEKSISESLAKTLYPDDSTLQGQELRLKQEYFFVSASLQDIVARHLRDHHTIERLADKIVIQLNDTHPALAVPEMLRILVDEHSYSWSEGWKMTKKLFRYTNHTLLSEALESWSVDMLGNLLPRHLELIYQINKVFLEEVSAHFNGDPGKLYHLSLIDDERQRVRMAHLAIVGSQRVNGVAVLHTHLLRTTLFADFTSLYPDRFVNVTNGITPRRWLLESNPLLSDLLSEKFGEKWITDLTELQRLREMLDDSSKLNEFESTLATIKAKNKERLVKMILQRTGIKVPETALFDVQVKRIHEYKRQLLNLLHIVVRYQQIIDGDGAELTPRVVLFAGKAAPGYYMAKQTIRLINDVAKVINNDPRVGDVLKIVFMPDYKVSDAQIIIPAADLSEQISTAGMEASGTGNMKLSLNGALTIGTLDGANIEIREQVGEDNFFLFGMTADEVSKLRERGYDPAHYYQSDEKLRKAVDAISQGEFSAEEPERYRGLIDGLLHGDHFMVMADFASYMEQQLEVDKLYQNHKQWCKAVISNIAGMGNFSADRAIHQYAENIWGIEPV
ncbi:MAG: glycogen/starch/alpha-glucan phosphorylase [Thiotrichales bacterium]|nr:glycogen/starch/alpha-glucan phosphorylase [Thiotrichales bacterium]MBT3613722.1 glycogen/starch/alpha-glucan phosphorylase [Thiotrichales bacterium]MBT3753092.1 glycogen/starch/alpha-glucan phosphorylase [Thiotrichales bacterium]MBT3838272.1 glycogen/starch/alpha-glucan phosphorylase [Thiotrichales bacterium]MBT4151683.1 glycogen/starch/alpha-glucan phosphorylase [Thiotrichales bacterium]